ncbi:MAG: UDP-2,4-diacetamido-2,4,6-trideoxy-beta-L-altropyranose hydrolase [Myxococcota bacterium]|nr:UDP-2,4-diacetamido-2,4,6-trideoxy-beta-L-altropyranose hydrolase [Myxococcota bacterium]
MVNVAVRTDANTKIGTGHFMRCLTLANALQRGGAECEFLCLSVPPPLQHQAETYGHQVTLLKSEAEVLKHLASKKNHWLLVDHYDLELHFEQQARPFTQALLVIEDLQGRHHACTHLLDASPLRVPEDLSAFIPTTCTLFLGPQYALLRPEFLAHRRPHRARWQRGFISLGGADPNNQCLALLNFIHHSKHLRKFQWTLVAGPANPHLKSLKHFASTCDFKLTLLPSSNQIAALMAEHDFAIGAGGGMTLERACIGLPTLAIAIADNQEPSIQMLRQFDLAETLELKDLNTQNIEESLNRLQKNSSLYFQRNQNFVDGLGAQRIAKAMLGLKDAPPEQKVTPC